MSTPPSAPVSDRSQDQDIAELVQLVGQALNSALLYGLDHKQARGAFELSHTGLTQFMKFHGALNITVNEMTLLLNGIGAPDLPPTRNLVTRLSKLNLLSFTIMPGFPLEEYRALFTALIVTPRGADTLKDPAELVKSLGFQHVEAKSFSYRLVSEDENGAPTGVPLAEGTGSPAGPDLDNILAFLKDDAAVNPERSMDDIRRLASDTEKLAELVLKAVEIRTTGANLTEGESLTDLVVGCIRKVVAPILKDPSVKTQKGRKHIRRSLMLLEKALLSRIQTLAGDQAAHATQEMMDEIAEDLDLDSVMSKYVKDRRAAEKSVEKMRRLVEQAGNDPEQLEDLRRDLVKQGLTQDGWDELRVSREPKPIGIGPDGSGDAVAEIKALTLLLARLGETINAPGTTPGDAAPGLRSLIAEAEAHMASLSSLTEKKITELHVKGNQMSRRQLIEFVAEIAQEITQPLTVITGTIALVRSQRTGPLNEAQGELLSMVTESGSRMAHLLDSLMKIAGTPDSTHPDQEILSAAYSGSQSTPPPASP